MPTKQQMRDEWARGASNWIERVRGRGDPSRNHLLDDWMLSAVGDVRGKNVIDLGCGEGRFCRMLAERGARMTGIDLSDEMIAAATGSRVGDESYAVNDMENLRGVVDASFDLAVSYITLVDVYDLPRAVAEAFRVLRTGGQFVVCNLAPMVTAGNMWVRYGDGTKLHYRLDNYLDETPREMPMCGTKFHNFHRTLSTYINTFIRAGFALEEIREPFPSPEQIEREPSNEDLLRVPLFIIYLLRKP
jgi:ubiquinone/menaquinone biosynthesis C-methylase UbiE